MRCCPRAAGGEGANFLLVLAALVAIVPPAAASFMDERGWSAVRRVTFVAVLATGAGALILAIGSQNAGAGLVGGAGLAMVASTSGLFFLGLRSVLKWHQD